jgi:hypothetical protein
MIEYMTLSVIQEIASLKDTFNFEENVANKTLALIKRKHER